MTILVVEDETAIREVESTYLTSAGYEVIEATTGPAALAAFQEHSFDAAIIDLNLPGLDGLDVCRVIRETSSLPILIVTARGSDDDEVTGLENGADDYVRKPFNPNVLVARVQALLRRHTTKELHFSGLTINPQTRTVTKNGGPVSLTTIRFNLLLALASAPNIVLSREQLVDRIYSDPTSHFVYDRTIDAHIKAVRQQVEDDPHAPRYIETVIGAGYRFKDPS